MIISDKLTEEKKRESVSGITALVGKHLSFFHPNLWTVISFALVFVVAGLFMKGELELGLVCLAAYVALDGVDGAVARHRNESTVFGALLDHSVDKLSEGIVLVSLGFAALPFLGASPFLFAGLAAWASILIAAIDAKGGEVWGSRVGRKLYGRAERMGLLVALIALAIPLGKGFLSPALAVFTLASLVTCAHLLWNYAKR